MQNAWNNRDMEAMGELLDKDIIVYVEPFTLNKFSISPEKIEGKENVLKFTEQLIKKLPLRYSVEYNKDTPSKNLTYRKFFYEIKAWGYFETLISEHGKFKEFKVGGYENVRAEKLTTFYVLKNIAIHKVKTFLAKKQQTSLAE